MFMCPNLEELRQQEKYSDISVIVEEKTFKCHRIILASSSSYFDTMFGGNFVERSMKEIHLKEVDAEVFEEVLRTIYSGELEITEVNVFNLLRTSDYLCIPTIRDPCINFILGNVRSIENVVEMFLWAHSMNIVPLMDVLLEDISNEFVRFSESDAFLKMSFDEVNAILLSTYSRNSSLIMKIDDFIMDTLIRWLDYSYAERKGYVEKFGSIISGLNLSSQYLQFLMIRYELNFAIPEERVAALKILNFRFSDYNLVVPSFNNLDFLTKNLSINLFLGTRVVSLNKYQPNGFISHRRDWCLHSDGIKIIQPRCESNFLYGWQTTSLEDGNSITSFRAYPSIALSEHNSRTLCPPPVTKIYNGAIDERSNDIYFLSRGGTATYLCSDVRNSIYPSNCKVFSDDEIFRGILRYNFELDRWFTIPRLKMYVLQSAKLLTNGSLLYMVHEDGQVRAYDTRSSQHLYLPKNNTVWRSRLNFDCCVVDNKIYSINKRTLEILDLTAGKWETAIARRTKKIDNYGLHRIVSYTDMLWLFHGRYEGDHLSIQVFNPRTRELEIRHNARPVFGKTVVGDCVAKGYILDDVIVFKLRDT